MTILSFGNFYLGIDPDSAPFFDVQIHIGTLRLEWSGTSPNFRGPNSETSYGRPYGEDPDGIRAAPIKGP